MRYNLEDISSLEIIARSMTDGMADHRLYLWVPEFLQDEEEKEFLVLKNTGTREQVNYEELYHFTAEYIRNKCCYALSQDGKFALAGYAAKKGVICYECESGKILWDNKKIKKIIRIRFNNFDSNIIEVINDKLEITYLDKQTGEILENDRIKQVRQVVNWMHPSKNGKYLITADPVSNKDKAIYTVYDTETGMVKGRFVAQNQLNVSTFDVTNDGQYAVCSAHQRQGVSFIKVETGEVIWTQKKVKKISKVYFDKEDEKIAVCCQYDGTYFLYIHSGEIAFHDYSEEIYVNTYGKDIRFCERNIAKIGRKQIESPSFAFLEAIGTPKGVVLNPVGEGVMLYDYEGNVLWENKNIEIGRIVYQEEDNTICGLVSTYDGKKIVILSAEDGKIVSELAIDNFPCTFIHHNKTLLCNTGKMYDVSQNNIRKKTEVFEFLVK